jgi:hypothetical protein
LREIDPAVVGLHQQAVINGQSGNGL